MRSIIFAWTTPALLAGVKTVTRRSWDSGYAERFHAGMLVEALDRDRRAGGKPIAVLRLTDDVKPCEHAPGVHAADWGFEGIPWLLEHGYGRSGLPRRFGEFEDWCRSEKLYVVRFSVERLTAHGERVRGQAQEKQRMPLFEGRP